MNNLPFVIYMLKIGPVNYLTKIKRGDRLILISFFNFNNKLPNSFIIFCIAKFVKFVKTHTLYSKVRGLIPNPIAESFQIVHHGFNLLSLPSDGNGVSGLLQIPLQIIPKGAFSSEVKWCADFSNTPLLTCGFVVF